MFISSIVVFFLSPIEHENRPLTDNEVIKYRKNARVLLLIQNLILYFLVLYLKNAFISISLSASMAVFFTAVLMLYKYKGGKKYEKSVIEI